MNAAEKPFKEYWASTVFPAITEDSERLLKTGPKRIAERAEKEKGPSSFARPTRDLVAAQWSPPAHS